MASAKLLQNRSKLSNSIVVVPSPYSSSTSTQSEEESDPVQHLADLIQDESLHRVVKLLREPQWTHPTSRPSTPPADINGSDSNGLLLLLVALRAKTHALFYFCLLLQAGADPEAVGKDNRRVVEDFQESVEQHECRKEWEKAVMAKRLGEAYTMPPNMDHEIDMAARKLLHARKLIRNAAVFHNSEPVEAALLAPAPAPVKRSHSEEIPAPAANSETPAPQLPPASASAPPEPTPAAKRPRVESTPPQTLIPAPHASTSAPHSQPHRSPVAGPSSSTHPAPRQQQGPVRRPRRPHYHIPLAEVPGYVRAQEENSPVPVNKMTRRDQRMIASAALYDPTKSLVPPRNTHVPSPSKPEILPVEDGVFLEVSASGKLYTPATLKPFGCTKEGCDKRFKNMNGLKYHRKHGKCSNSGADRGGIGEGKPFVCHDAGCGKRYKNKNGLRYHYENSGAHGVTGNNLLANGTHPAPEYDDDGNGDYQDQDQDASGSPQLPEEQYGNDQPYRPQYGM